MRRSRVPIAERRVIEANKNHNSSQRKVTPFDPRITRKKFSVSMFNTRRAKENETKARAEGGLTEPAIEIGLETPDQSVDEVEKKTTESTPMPNAEEQKQKTMKFSPIDTVEDTTGNTPETIKDESQTKRTSFTERFAKMVGMKSRDIVEDEPKAEKGKTFGTVSTITTEVNQGDDQVKHRATAGHGALGDHERATLLELRDLMAKLDQIDKKLECCEEDQKQNAEEQKQKTMKFSPIDTVEDTTGNTLETIKDESQTKRTSFTERFAKMVGMKSRDIVEDEPKAEKGKTFGTVSTITTEVNQGDDQVKHRATASHRALGDHERATLLELRDLMAKLDQIDKKLECCEEDREVIRKEIRYNKNEYLDHYFNLARATEEKLQQMSDKVEATDKDRDRNIKKDMQETKQRYDTVNSKLGNLETRLNIMSRD